MTEKENKLRDCLRRTADRILVYADRPIPAFCRAALRDIYETIRDTGVAVLENQPYPPEAEPDAATNEARDTVIVTVYGGCVQSVEKSNPHVRVIVRDYDVDDSDEQKCGLTRDAEGQLYAEWEEG